jgi:pilus assembly protein TadC
MVIIHTILFRMYSMVGYICDYFSQMTSSKARFNLINKERHKGSMPKELELRLKKIKRPCAIYFFNLSSSSFGIEPLCLSLLIKLKRAFEDVIG